MTALQFPSRAEQRCSCCFYGQDIAGRVLCQRYAPRPGDGESGELSYWPQVAITAWCGEWAPREAA